MKNSIVITLIFLLSIPFINAQDKEKKKEKKKATFAVKVLQNSVAGFYPIFFGNFETNKKFDITTYTIFWTNPSFGNPEANRDLLLETGAGIGFKLFDNKLYLNPSLGISNGKFLSNGKGTRIGEGIVPNLFLVYNQGAFEFEGYIGLYKSIREDNDIDTRDFLLNWAAPGVKVSDRVVLGAFYEYFGITRQQAAGGKPVIYQWLGASIKLKFDNGIALRVSAGPTLKTDIGTADDFYKASIFIPL